MRRREFISVLGGATAWPLAAHAQQPIASIPRVGFLALPKSGVAEIQQGLQQLGYIDGQNIAFEVRSVQGRLERLRELAADLVRHNVAMIVTEGPQSTQAAREASDTIPIVMARMDDADAQGFVTNYARPGGNITGLSFPTGELSTKWLQLLKETLPSGARIATLWDATGTANQLRTIEIAARSVKVDLYRVEWRGSEEFTAACLRRRKMPAQKGS
jgi:ABC-type uncharacterized transport system substrate-binding protein